MSKRPLQARGFQRLALVEEPGRVHRPALAQLDDQSPLVRDGDPARSPPPSDVTDEDPVTAEVPQLGRLEAERLPAAGHVAEELVDAA